MPCGLERTGDTFIRGLGEAGMPETSVLRAKDDGKRGTPEGV